MKDLQIVAIVGSLRRDSLNRALVRAAAELAPQGVNIVIAEIRDIPLYDGDLAAEGKPDAVQKLEAQIHEADAVLIATPEYNYSIPGVLKNALDWVSRPAYRGALAGKPVAIVGAAMSTVGTARAQSHLKQVLLSLTAEVFPYPEFLLARAHERFEDGELVDEGTRDVLGNLLAAFTTWVRTRTHGGAPRNQR